MKTRYTLTLSVLLGLLMLLAFKAADDPFDLLLKKMSAYIDKNPQEKVHLHLDKPYYAIGDDIWFKAYVIDASTGAPSSISQSIYVDLIDEIDSNKIHLKLPLMGGVTWGDFKLPDSLSEGNYRIRAYTQLMRNAGPDFFYDKTIKIGNSWANKVFTKASHTYLTENNEQKVNTKILFTDKDGKPYANTDVSYVVNLEDKNVARGKAETDAQGAIALSFRNTTKTTMPKGRIIATLNLPGKENVIKVIPITAVSNNLDLQFFPEGGDMVTNLPIKIGVKATMANGRGKDVSGVIVDQQGNTITNFSTQHLGMGSIILNPQPGFKYTAVIKKEDGSEQRVSLPQVKSAGYVLSVNNLDSTKVTVKVYVSDSLINKGVLKVIAQNQGTVYATAKINTGKQVTNISIPKKDIPSGILQITLFGPENNPAAERLIFIDNQQDLMNLQVSTDKNQYAAREKVSISLKANGVGESTIGTFSVAVTNSAVVKPDEDNESNILTSLLLTSDLPGYIEQPNYYFKNSAISTIQHLDNLLLTQGWRRFQWKDIIREQQPDMKYQPEKSLKISGTLTNLGGKPIANGKVTLFSSTGGILMLDTLSDANGKFVFDNLLFGDSTKFVVQGRTTKDKKNTDIKLDIIPGQVVTKNKNTGDIEVNVNESISSYIQQSDDYFEGLTKRGLLQRTQLLKQVDIVDKRPNAKNSSNLNGGGRADAVITAEDLKNAFSISQALQGRVAGLVMRNGIPFLTRFGSTSPMQVIIDGMYVEADFLDMINIQDVESIEVLKSGSNLAIYGSRGGGGVLIINTKRGLGLAGSRYTPGIVTYNPKGYNSGREFYSPKYDAANNSSAPDLRTTVYWNPKVVTDAAGNAKFEYFNADTKGTYRIVIEGINAAGHLGRTVYTYEVK